MDGVVSIPAIAGGLTVPWQPTDLTTVNDAIVRLARFDGEFAWHEHDEDELFLCWSGTFRIERQNLEPVQLVSGDIFVVPAGTMHRPVADRGPAYGLMLERPETLPYGNRRDGDD